MEKEFVPYELALKMKVLGFDEPCFGFYNNADGNVWIKHTIDESIKNIYIGDFEAPTFSQAFRWFRDKHNLYPSINIYNDKWLCLIKSTVSSETEISGYIVATINNGYPTFETYEEAELACLKKLIELVEQNV
jgi:hypothetical protein